MTLHAYCLRASVEMLLFAAQLVNISFFYTVCTPFDDMSFGSIMGTLHIYLLFFFYIKTYNKEKYVL